MYISRRTVAGILTGVCMLMCTQWVHGQPVRPAGAGNLDGWQGVSIQHQSAELSLPGSTRFTFGEKSEDLYDWYGIRLDVQLPDDRTVELNIALRTPDDLKTSGGVGVSTTLQGKGWHSVVLPWSRFNATTAANYYLRNIREIAITGTFNDQQTGKINLRNVQIIRARTTWLDGDIQSQSVAAGSTADYTLTVGNCTESRQAIDLVQQRTGFEAMETQLEPRSLILDPGQTAQVKVKVRVPARVPQGGHEKQTIFAISNGNTETSESLTLVTASRMQHPYIIHTSEGWQQIRENVKKYDWAKEAQQEYVVKADKWSVPEVFKAPAGTTREQMKGRPLFNTTVEHDLMAAGISYQLTGQAQYAQKVRQFLLNLSNPNNGYPATLRGCNQASVQEGHFFQHIAMAYDMALPSGIFTDADKAQINHTLKLFVDGGPGLGGNISNWSVSSLTGGLYCALVLQDLKQANRMLYAPGGLIDQFVQGTLDDGWWFECSISYNVWCATEFSQVALAMRPWGIDLINTSFPSGYRPNNTKQPEQEEYGMSRARWGPIYHNTLRIKDMWDALPPMLDYRGIMFGLNDSTERRVSGPAMDIAYYIYRDPAYANIIKRGDGKRDLLYAVPELPDQASSSVEKSAFADNAGVVVLRSQDDKRPPREQIQAILHYGDHGWYHGHFDRTNLLHLSRYGRSFFNPEMIWYGYPSYLYKFYVQTSINKNMVVVDQKMQEPAESQRLQFFTGKLMQATTVQTYARWSNPPFGGMMYDDQRGKSLAEKAFAEGRSFPVPENAPAYGSLTGYTEPILQRRAMIVTSDYVLLADYVKGNREHTFESLFQMKGFQKLDSTDKKLIRHTGQWTTDPLSSAQFVTDCDWYSLASPARGTYQFLWGPGADNTGTRTEFCEDGVLNIDLHTLWPAQQEMMIGTVPETHDVQKQVQFALRADGQTLQEGRSGMWILGEKEIKVPLKNCRTLELTLQASTSKLQSLFLGGARVTTSDGKEIALRDLPITVENVIEPKEKAKDFGGGPVKIAGIAYQDAISAQPRDAKKPATIRIDLSQVNATEFKAVLGSDFPVGDESQRRKTVAQRIVDKEAQFLTVMEPYESSRMIRAAKALDASHIQVDLTDGRTHIIAIDKIKDINEPVSVTIAETRDGKTIQTENTER